MCLALPGSPVFIPGTLDCCWVPGNKQPQLFSSFFLIVVGWKVHTKWATEVSGIVTEMKEETVVHGGSIWHLNGGSKVLLHVISHSLLFTKALPFLLTQFMLQWDQTEYYNKDRVQLRCLHIFNKQLLWFVKFMPRHSPPFSWLY